MEPELEAQINNLPSRVVFQSEQTDGPQVQHDALFKVIIVGDTGVGKTCILQRLIKQQFEEEHNVTIGVEFGNFGMVMREQTHVKLQIWDTAGQESFRSITRLFYKDSDAVFVCFDLTCRKSFDDLKSWLEEVNNNTSNNLVRYLVGNFADLPDERVVSSEEATAFMREHGFMHYLETSAKSGQNVNELFQTITKHLFITHEANLDKFVSPPF